MCGAEKYFSKHILKRGCGLECPNEGAVCLMNLKAFQDDENILFDDKEIKWVLGQDYDYVSELINECLEEMHVGDLCQISIHPCQELKEHLKKFPTSNQTNIDYEVELISFEKIKNSWELTIDERLTYAKEQKAKGTSYYKAGMWLFAARHYSKALRNLILARMQLPSDINNDDFCLLQVHCYSNLAACQVKLERHRDVISNCTKVLKMDSANVKAFYRRAQANIVLKNFEKARSDLTKALGVEPKNQDIIKLKRELEEKMKRHDAVTARAVKKMF